MTTSFFAAARLAPVLVVAAACTTGDALADSVTTPAKYADLGTLGGSGSVALGVSANGSVVVGEALTGAAALHAFRWTAAGGMADLGTLGGTTSLATGVNAVGSVVVGEANIAGDTETHAFRWTASGGMVDIGTPGFFSAATGVNADGSVVVGAADGHAFRWTAGAGMTDLGTLGGSSSAATGVNATGSVVVGDVFLVGVVEHAFRWTPRGGMVDIGTLGGAFSQALGVNADGSVVVGQSNTMGTATHAFRWTTGGGMADLGTLAGGSFSQAKGVNADGSVVVGLAETALSAERAFRWTQASGMISVDNWLRGQGVRLASDVTAEAFGVSADGNVIAGVLQNDHAFIARGATTGQQTVSAGLMDVDNYQSSLAGMGRFDAAVAGADMTINGANSSPLFNLLDAGRSDVWTSGDLGRVYTKAWGGTAAVGQIGVAHSPVQGLTVRASVGTTYDKQALFSGGDSRVRGTYVLPEATLALGHGVYGTLTGYANWGDFAERRGYANGDGIDLSSGAAGTQTYGFRARVDWQNAVRLVSTDLSPYASFTRTSTYVGAYTEQGGAFPSFINGGTENADVARVGSDATYALTSWLTLIGRAEYAHRFEQSDAATTGTILGLSDFSVAGLAVRQDWVRGGLGAKALIGPGEALVMANASNQTAGATYWLNLGYRILF